MYYLLSSLMKNTPSGSRSFNQYPKKQSAKYGEEHKKARQERLESLPVQQCEVTGQRRDLTAHHQVPKMFDGPDMAQNYLILSKAFHDYLHAICNVTDSDLIQKRISLAQYIRRHILDDVKREAGIKELDAIDNILMPEYIDNLVNTLAQEFHQMIHLTILNNFHTIKHQAIKIAHLEAKQKALEIE